MADASQLFRIYERLRLMREKEPVFFNEKVGHWEVFRYADVLRVLTDHATFSSAYQMLGLSAARLVSDTMISSDPPRHRQLRGLASQAFTPRRVALLEPRIEQLVAELLDAVEGAQTMDVIADLAHPLPTVVIAELLGVDPALRESFKRWSDAMLIVLDSRHHADAARVAEQAHHLEEMSGYFEQAAADRRRKPTDDFISALVRAEIDGRGLTDRELVNLTNLTLVAGHETTTNLIGNAVICLAQHPHVLSRVRANPSLIPGVVEETLRYLSPISGVARISKTEVSLGQVVIPAGQLVWAWLASANRDPAQFGDPDDFDIDREPGQQLAFGHGIHFCLGMPLARMEARIALTAMLARLPGSWRLPDAPLRPIPLVQHSGVVSLPLRWDGCRESAPLLAGR